MSDEDLSLIKFVQVGYHLRYAKAFSSLRTMICDCDLGLPLVFNAFSGKGISYKPDFVSSWHSRTRSQIVETLSTHQINLAYYLFSCLPSSQGLIFEVKFFRIPSMVFGIRLNLILPYQAILSLVLLLALGVPHYVPPFH